MPRQVAKSLLDVVREVSVGESQLEDTLVEFHIEDLL